MMMVHYLHLELTFTAEGQSKSAQLQLCTCISPAGLIGNARHMQDQWTKKAFEQPSHIRARARTYRMVL